MMEKKDIVKKFLEMKVQLTPIALEKIYNNQEIISKLEELVKKENLPIIDETLIDTLLSQKNEKVKILIPEAKEEFSIEEVLNYLKKRFEILSSIFQKNTSLKNIISISKLERSKLKERVTVIGMVKDKTNYSVTLEDFTGNITLSLESTMTENLFIDDVIAIEVVSEEGRLKGEKIYFPSFSFFRKLSNKNIELLNSEFLRIENEAVKIPEVEVAKIVLDDIFLIVLDYSIVKPYRIKDKSITETVASLLERRHLNPSFFISKKIYQEDPFLLQDIPEAIIVKKSGVSEQKIYKGVKIFTLP